MIQPLEFKAQRVLCSCQPRMGEPGARKLPLHICGLKKRARGREKTPSSGSGPVRPLQQVLFGRSIRAWDMLEDIDFADPLIACHTAGTFLWQHTHHPPQ